MGDKEWGGEDALAAHLDRGALLDIIDSLTVALAIQARATTATIGRVDALQRAHTQADAEPGLDKFLATVRSLENELVAVGDALDAASAPAVKRDDLEDPDGRPMSNAGRIAWLARRSDAFEPMRAELIRILDLFPNLRASMPGERGTDITKDLAPAVAALQEQLRSTAKRLDLADEARRRALAERDCLRQSVLNFIEDTKKKVGLQ